MRTRACALQSLAFILLDTEVGKQYPAAAGVCPAGRWREHGRGLKPWIRRRCRWQLWAEFRGKWSLHSLLSEHSTCAHSHAHRHALTAYYTQLHTCMHAWAIAYAFTQRLAHPLRCLEDKTYTNGCAWRKLVGVNGMAWICRAGARRGTKQSGRGDVFCVTAGSWGAASIGFTEAWPGCMSRFEGPLGTEPTSAYCGPAGQLIVHPTTSYHTHIRISSNPKGINVVSQSISSNPQGISAVSQSISTVAQAISAVSRGLMSFPNVFQGVSTFSWGTSTVLQGISTFSWGTSTMSRTNMHMRTGARELMHWWCTHARLHAGNAPVPHLAQLHSPDLWRARQHSAAAAVVWNQAGTQWSAPRVCNAAAWVVCAGLCDFMGARSWVCVRMRVGKCAGACVRARVRASAHICVFACRRSTAAYMCKTGDCLGFLEQRMDRGGCLFKASKKILMCTSRVKCDYSCEGMVVCGPMSWRL